MAVQVACLSCSSWAPVHLCLLCVLSCRCLGSLQESSDKASIGSKASTGDEASAAAWAASLQLDS